jgi:hypothetical protein
MNLWKIPPLPEKSLIHSDNNIYVIKNIFEDTTINSIKTLMDHKCENGVQYNITQHNKNTIEKEIDQTIFNQLMKCLKYMNIRINSLPYIEKDTGYNLLKSNNNIYNNLLPNDIRNMLFITIALDDLEYNFKHFNKIKLKKNSMIIMPYSWNYMYEINPPCIDGTNDKSDLYMIFTSITTPPENFYKNSINENKEK